MNKKFFLIIVSLVLFISSGCVNKNIANMTVESAVRDVVATNLDMYNNNNVGYRYYLPRNFSLVQDNKFNQVLTNKGNKYYMYVDIVSYYNKVDIKYDKNEDALLSMQINVDGKTGYVEITKKPDYIFIKMVYNYAIIEVRVPERDLKDSTIYMATILNSIKYNDSIISNIVGNSVLETKEVVFDFFKPTVEVDSKNFLDYVKEYGDYKGTIDDLPDSDLVGN